MCIPSGTRQASTQTVYVRVVAVCGGTGARGWVVVIVAQSTPSRPMMWVAKVSVPGSVAVPPVLRRGRATDSQWRVGVGARVGVPRVRAAGVGVGLPPVPPVVTMIPVKPSATTRGAASALRDGRRLVRDPRVMQRTGIRSLTVTGYGAFPWQVDGDYLGDIDHLTLSWQPDALTIVVP